MKGFWAKESAQLVIPVRSTFQNDLHPPTGGHHPVLYFTTNVKKKYCTAMCYLFLGPKFWFLAKKSIFCHTTQILVALGMTVNFPHWERFFDFPFWSYSCFRKKIWLTCQKVFPPPTVGAPSASKSPSALSARA